MESYINQAIQKCLKETYWEYKVVKIYENNQIYKEYDYGIFLKPKLHFREKLWEVNTKKLFWKRVELNGTWYYKNKIIKDDRYVWIAKDEEHKVVFYR